MKKFLLGAAFAALVAGPAVAAPGTGFNIANTPTIQNAVYASGNCMGGFQTIKLGSASSVLSSLTLASKGALVQPKTIYLFSANPTSSTCTDKSTFTLNAADVSKLMASPFLMTASAPTGTTVTTVTQPGLSLGVPPGGVIYEAIVEGGTETPATPTDLVTLHTGF